jgi:hypothetical protein
MCYVLIVSRSLNPVAGIRVVRLVVEFGIDRTALHFPRTALCRVIWDQKPMNGWGLDLSVPVQLQLGNLLKLYWSNKRQIPIGVSACHISRGWGRKPGGTRSVPLPSELRNSDSIVRLPVRVLADVLSSFSTIYDIVCFHSDL